MVIRRETLEAVTIRAPLDARRSLQRARYTVGNVGRQVIAVCARNVAAVKTPIAGLRILAAAVIAAREQSRGRGLAALVIGQSHIAADAPISGPGVFQGQRSAPYLVAVEILRGFAS